MSCRGSKKHSSDRREGQSLVLQDGGRRRRNSKSKSKRNCKSKRSCKNNGLKNNSSERPRLNKFDNSDGYTLPLNHYNKYAI